MGISIFRKTLPTWRLGNERGLLVRYFSLYGRKWLLTSLLMLGVIEYCDINLLDRKLVKMSIYPVV